MTSWWRRLLGQRGTGPQVPDGQPWAAVHRGPHHVPGCPEAAAELLASVGISARMVGQGEPLCLKDALAAGPTLLVQPGGGDLETAWTEVGRDRAAVRRYVEGGGRYLGICLGGYLAGGSPGYGLFPGDTDQLAVRTGSTLRHTRDTVIEVEWEGRTREVYAQDPPAFLLDDDDDEDVEVLARYDNGDVAALVAPCGEGVVALCGPHPEATPDWYADAGLTPARPDARDLARELVRRLGVTGP